MTAVSFVACAIAISSPIAAAQVVDGFIANLHVASVKAKIAAAKIISCTKYTEYIEAAADRLKAAHAPHAAILPMD